MKKLLCIVLVLMLLSGCGSRQTYETVEDEWLQPVMAKPRQISVELPEDAIAPVLESEGEQVYLCSDYEIIIETRASGDLTGTVERICGYGPDALTVLETAQGDTDRYEFVWASTGETGERLGRAVILDDGDYHYCMSVLRDASAGRSQISWDDVFRSFQLI